MKEAQTNIIIFALIFIIILLLGAMTPYFFKKFMNKEPVISPSGSDSIADAASSGSVCGNGVWQKRETLDNCADDCTEFCNPPPNEIKVISTGDYIIGTYIWPRWHAKYPNPSVAGWDQVRNATPLVDGADQPKKPLLNYYDDSNPIA